VLRGNLTYLRGRRPEDVPVLQAELYDDVPVRTRADSRPWVPIPATAEASPYAVRNPADDAAFFSVVETATDDLAGEAVVWGIDLHQRSAHLGLSLRPDFRGRGLGTDTVLVLCHYGFTVRGLHRLQMETLADNPTMVAAATAAGFTVEGRRRESGWAEGRFNDEIVLGLLRREFQHIDSA
jgi:RimJ/RimL family protein N-acetyltransferase